MRRELIEELRKTLAASGFKVSEEHNLRSVCFDIVARRDNLLLFLKVVTNVDAINEDGAEELKLLSKILGGMPMLIGLHSGAGPLEDEVMYSRFDVPLVTPNTFHDYIVEEIPPLVFAAPGGYYVHLNGEMLHRIREERSISLGDVANAAGVSRRTIQLYEEGERGALVEVAVRIEEYLDYPLIKPVNPLRSNYEIDMSGHVDAIRGIEKMFQEAFAHLVETGCHVVPTHRSPFETVVEERLDLLLTGVGKYDRTLIKKAHVIGDVSGVVERESLIVVDRRTRKDNIDGTPIIDISEILKKGNLEELLELIRERSKR